MFGYFAFDKAGKQVVGETDLQEVNPLSLAHGLIRRQPADFVVAAVYEAQTEQQVDGLKRAMASVAPSIALSDDHDGTSVIKKLSPVVEEAGFTVYGAHVRPVYLMTHKSNVLGM